LADRDDVAATSGGHATAGWMTGRTAGGPATSTAANGSCDGVDEGAACRDGALAPLSEDAARARVAHESTWPISPVTPKRGGVGLRVGAIVVARASAEVPKSGAAGRGGGGPDGGRVETEECGRARDRVAVRVGWVGARRRKRGGREQ